MGRFFRLHGIDWSFDGQDLRPESISAPIHLADLDSEPISVQSHKEYPIVIRTDPYTQMIYLSFSVFALIHHYVAASGPAVAHTNKVTLGAAQPDVSVSTLAPKKPQDRSLCRSIQHSPATRTSDAAERTS